MFPYFLQDPSPSPSIPTNTPNTHPTQPPPPPPTKINPPQDEKMRERLLETNPNALRDMVTTFLEVRCVLRFCRCGGDA